jgi:hypothetical protein
MKLEFILVQKAKSKGGDKYTCVSDPTFSIYVPQTISRNSSPDSTISGDPKTKLTIDVE